MLVARLICLYEFDVKNIGYGTSWVFVTRWISVTYHVRMGDVGKMDHGSAHDSGYVPDPI